MDAVDRMFQVLVRAIRSRHARYLAAPFTAAELQQQIIPFRHYRRDLGLDSNQEYELTVMQLLSGAKGYLDVDERMRDAFTKELASTSPRPERVREFAESQASLNADAAAHTGPPPDMGSPAVAVTPALSAARCRFCGGELPRSGGRDINFCPHCGQNLRVRHCPACGAETEEGWKFCVSCGKTVG